MMSDLESLREMFGSLLMQGCLSAFFLIACGVAVVKLAKATGGPLGVLWRRSRGAFAALAILALCTTLNADKTNEMMRSIHRFVMRDQPSLSVSEAEISNGYRVEGVATNSDPFAAMPSNAVEYARWSMRGGFAADFALDLGGFIFPMGTNRVSRFDVLSGGAVEPLPRGTSAAIYAAREQASLVPGVSRFWSADADDGAKVLRWDRVFANRDSTDEYTAEMRFFQNGDFTTRSNEVETAYRRVNPDDWDDDGIANERDLNPLLCDGDFYGVANALPSNANLNAYYWLDLSVTGLLDCATIRVTCDGPSDLGDHVIIAVTNQLCHVPLLAGATYAVESDLPIDYSAVSSEYAEIATNSATSLTVSLPLELYFERVQMRCGSDSYLAHTSPIDIVPELMSVAGTCCSAMISGNGLQWTCLSTCTCGGMSHSLETVATWEGYSKCFASSAACGCSVDAPEPTPQYGPYAASVYAAFSKNTVIFEDGYLNKPGEFVPRRSTSTTLTIHANGGPNGGVLTVMGTNLSKLQKNSGPAFPISSIIVPAEHSLTYEIGYVGIEASLVTNDVIVAASFLEHGSTNIASNAATATVVRVELAPMYAAPFNDAPHRHLFGVMEDVFFSTLPECAQASWQFFEGPIEMLSIYGNKVIMPAVTNQFSEGNCEARVTAGDACFTNTFKFYMPEIIAVNPRCNEDIEAHIGEAGWLLLHMDLYVCPFFVSFNNLQMVEIPDESGICPHGGYYENVEKGGPLSHGVAAGAGNYHYVGLDGYWCSDRAGRGGRYDEPWSNGWKEWPISVGWGASNVILGQFDQPPTTQRFTLLDTGTFSIRKYDYEAVRTTWNNIELRMVEQ